MGLYERILVPTDGSPPSEAALEHALELAAVHDATVHALYVVDTAAIAGLTMETAWEGVSEMLYREGDSALDEARATAGSRAATLETETREGTPAREIVRYAEEIDCDLVVMGTHGRGGIDRLLLGSVTEQVVRACRIPVLTVRVPED